jgi:hypothetical protein
MWTPALTFYPDLQEEDVETVMQHVVGVVEAFNKRHQTVGSRSLEYYAAIK